MKTRKYAYASRQAAEDACREKERRLTVCQLLLYDIARGKEAVRLAETVEDESGDRIEADCYRLDCASGGICLVRYFNGAGELTGTGECYVDDFFRDHGRDDCGFVSPARWALRRLAYAMLREQREANERPVMGPAPAQGVAP